jgi:hypothetical protein
MQLHRSNLKMACTRGGFQTMGINRFDEDGVLSKKYAVFLSDAVKTTPY